MGGVNVSASDGEKATCVVEAVSSVKGSLWMMRAAPTEQ